MTDKHLTQLPVDEFVTFASDDCDVHVECRFEHETLATFASLYYATSATGTNK
ncbi:Uncharacterised protein [Serratia fonticola]|uniref:hypothetical protein n=1 Tax=Serratia fonticola TaxID=47917 RepID=UPI00217BAEF3|nr:Uncharacterised protein [Serratia fonticola]